MYTEYNKLYDKYKIPTVPERDKRPDISFKELRPECPYKFFRIDHR